VHDALALLWTRACTREAIFTADELARWPDGLVDRLVERRILREANTATVVVCDACAGDHVEEVFWVESPLGSVPRAYHSCPEAGRVPVPAERLRRWAIDFNGLATCTAAALSTAGEVAEVVPSRAWLLGKTTLSGSPRELFLLRGLSWPDGQRILDQARRLGTAVQPVGLLLGEAPPGLVWPADQPPLLSLSAVLSWDEAGIVADRAALATALPHSKGKKPARLVTPFPTPAGASWEDIQIQVAGDRLLVNVRGRSRKLTFQEAGFEDQRRKATPDRLWGLLRVFALCGGVVPFDSDHLLPAQRTNLKQNISQLGKRLRHLFQLEDQPFRDSRKTKRYVARFALGSEEGVRFPVPAGVTWDSVSLTEIREGYVRVTVDVCEDFVTFEAGEGANGRWEGAQREGTLQRDYDLRVLGLADAVGHPNPAGEAFLEVLRNGGKVNRPDDDDAMLTLGHSLTGFLQIQHPPFQFVKARCVWSALFDASSLVGRPLGRK
jgi:hypothetical protein